MNETKDANSENNCTCDTDKKANKNVLVEYLYLDLKTCERCIGTEGILDEVMKTLIPALKIAGYNVEYLKKEMTTEEVAKKYKFESSPTIRVNNEDICESIKENNCECCSEISGTDVDCRLYEYEGRTYERPPKEMLAASILGKVFGNSKGSCSGDYAYKLPKNLSRFYDGKKKEACSCSGECC